jgi:glycosyltransferase involved in cell wall biosynthesis
VWRTHHVAMLLTWYREGVPRSLIEAAASGRPIVTTDSPGCRDLVRDGQEGILVPLRDIEAAARALVELASDPQLRAQLGGAAHARFMERFTEAEVRRRVRSVYSEFRL